MKIRVQMFPCFPAHRCQEEFQLRSSQTYMRLQVLEAEQGICQLCGLHVHDLFLKVRDAPPSKRKGMLENTWLAQLSLKQVGHQGEENKCSNVILQTCYWKSELKV